MDPQGVLAAVVAVAVYPGAALVAAMAWVVARTGGLRRVDPGLTASGAAALLAAAAAAAMAPLPASPVAATPPGSGPAPNLLLAAMTLAAAVLLGTGPAGRTGRRLAAVLVLVPAAAIVAGAGTLSLPALTAQPGLLPLLGRIGVSAALLLAAPALCDTFGERPLMTRAALTAVTAELAFSLVMPPGLAGIQAGLAVAALIVAVGVYGGVVRGAQSLGLLGHPVHQGLGAVAGALTIAAVALSGR